ncbi:hypothetical protein CEQ90_13860 [Lewinellaceae bacterium SD302]|nr:hypothetical protein CEQ90_13860 [Lewinellaceae bacterium SD302]
MDRLLTTIISCLCAGFIFGQAAMINEINHVANDPNGHGIEVVAAAGEDLTGWTLLIYTADGLLDQLIDLSNAVVPNQSNGHGTIWYDVVQNDGGNGAALVDPTGGVTQFLSYGTNTIVAATNGAAAGNTAVPMISLTGILAQTGSSYNLGGFSWVTTATSSPGSINTDQIFMLLMESDETVVDIKAPGKASVYPNPFVDTINVRFEPATGSLGALSLFDANGRRCQVQTIPVGAISATVKLKKDLPAGTYILRLDTERESWSKVITH